MLEIRGWRLEDLADVKLDPGQMIIYSDALKAVEEKIAHLIDRRKYYFELADLNSLEELQSCVKQVRKTAKAEA